MLLTERTSCKGTCHRQTRRESGFCSYCEPKPEHKTCPCGNKSFLADECSVCRRGVRKPCSTCGLNKKSECKCLVCPCGNLKPRRDRATCTTCDPVVVRVSGRKSDKRDKGGYILAYAPDHPSANSEGRVYQHRLVMEAHIGRPLDRSETVHHKNGIRSDNQIENLELWSGHHPRGGRVSDKCEWAIEFLTQHGYEVTKKT